MSIHALLGKPGAGKSYNAVQRILEALDTGRVVMTSLPVKLSHPRMAAALEDGSLVMMPQASEAPDPARPGFSTWAGWSRAFDDKGGLARDIKGKDGTTSRAGPLLIVDEAASTLRPMVAASKGRGKSNDYDVLLGKLETHRHYAIDVLLIYQDHTQIVAQVKALIERFHTFTNTSEMTAPLKTWTMKTTARGHATTQATALAEAKGRFDPKIFELYDSHAEGSAKGEKVKLDRKGLLSARPLWLRWWFILLVLSIVALPVMIYKTWTQVKTVSTYDADKFKAGGFGHKGQPVASALAPVPGAVPGVGPVPVSSPGGAVPVAVPGAAPVVAGVTALPVVSSLVLIDGAPGDGATMAGFGRSTIYFVDGGQSTVEELVLAGWRMLGSSPCRITIGRDEPKRQLRVYRCAKGF